MREVARPIPGQSRFCALVALKGVLPCEGWGVTDSQLDLPSLAPLSVAECGGLQLGVAYWATSVTLLQVVDNWPHKLCL